MKRFKATATTLVFLLGLGLPAAASAAPLQTVALQGQADACKGLSQLGATCDDPHGATPGKDSIEKTAATVVNIISLIAGIATVILIVISGVKFITSGGDSQAVASARNTMIYAIIGIVIVVAAQMIVHFVLNAALTGSSNTGVT